MEKHAERMGARVDKSVEKLLSEKKKEEACFLSTNILVSEENDYLFRIYDISFENTILRRKLPTCSESMIL